MLDLSLAIYNADPANKLHWTHSTKDKDGDEVVYQELSSMGCGGR